MAKHRIIFNVCLAIFQNYAWKDEGNLCKNISTKRNTVSYKFKRTHTVEYSIIHSTKLDSLTSNCLDSLTRICAIWTDKNHYIYLPNILNCSSNNVFPEDDVTANPFWLGWDVEVVSVPRSNKVLVSWKSENSRKNNIFETNQWSYLFLLKT